MLRHVVAMIVLRSDWLVVVLDVYSSLALASCHRPNMDSVASFEHTEQTKDSL